MSRSSDIALRKLQQELTDLRARVPLRLISGVGDRFNVITSVNGGQTIWTSGASTLKGIKYPASGLTSVPTQDPTATAIGSMADGLGTGTLNGTTVYVCLKATVASATVTDMVSDLPVGITILSRMSIRLPVGSTEETATVYFPWKV